MSARTILILLFAILPDLAPTRAAEPTATNSLAANATAVVKQGADAAAAHVSMRVQDLWNLTVFTVPGKPPIQVSLGKVLIGLVVLLLCSAIVRVFLRRMARDLRERFSVDESRSEGLEKLSFILLTCLIVLFILQWLEIPLTAFAFLGGALAIGVGFGAQNMINNFISGLILLAERRVRVGDVIEVDTATAQTGTVVHLGTRCSRILKADGVEVMVPNSYFLDKNVSNWTLSDSRHRYEFTVGFSYGTPVAAALKLLEEAVKAEEKVMLSPPPAVFFEAFGPASLVFHIYYWIDITNTDFRAIGSNIRRRIDRESREQNLPLASPQFQVRLDPGAPLSVHLLPPSES